MRLMTPTGDRSTDRLARRRRYRRLFVGLVGGAVAGSLALRIIGYPLVAEAVYLLGLAGILAVVFGAPVTLFDERDAALERRASQITIGVFAFVLILGASAARLLPRLTPYEVPPEVRGALYGYVAVFVVFGVAYGYVRSKR